MFVTESSGGSTMVPPNQSTPSQTSTGGFQSTGGSTTQSSLSGEVSKSTGPVVTGNILFDKQGA